MIANDAAILQRMVENWEKELPLYIEKLEDKVISRKVLPVRTVGEDVAIDVVATYDRTGAGASIMAKGAPPKGSGVVAAEIPHTIYQIMDGFQIHEKDIKLDSKAKTRQVEIIMNNIQRFENKLVLQGDVPHGITGVAGAAAANANGVQKVVGKWDGTGTAPKYYDDFVSAVKRQHGNFDPAFCVGNRTDMMSLFNRSSQQETPVWKQIATLFGKTEQDSVRDWMIMTGDDTLPTGKVYILPKDSEAAEFVVSENPAIRSIAQQRGGNYPIELYEWVTPEFHRNDAFVEIQVDTEL